MTSRIRLERVRERNIYNKNTDFICIYNREEELKHDPLKFIKKKKRKQNKEIKSQSNLNYKPN